MYRERRSRYIQTIITLPTLTVISVKKTVFAKRNRYSTSLTFRSADLTSAAVLSQINRRPPQLQEVHTIQQPPRGLSSMRGFGWWRSSKLSSRHRRCLYVTTDCDCRRRQHAATCYLCVEPACSPFHHVLETKSSNRLTFTVRVQ